MKNKRNVLIAFILICCLCLSIGYAALTDTLIINGSASAVTSDNDDDGDTLEEAFDDNLGFTAVVQANGNTANVSLKNGETAVTSTQSTFAMTDEVTFSASGFAKKGDKAVITYTITNNHPDLSASVNVPVLTADGTNDFSSEYFQVTNDWTQADVVAANGGTKTVTITVEMIKTPVNDKTASFKLTFTATAQEAASNSGT